MVPPKNPSNKIENVGVGLRAQHYEHVLKNSPEIPWLEVHSENFFKKGSTASLYLNDINKNYPMSLHGVGLSLGSADGIDPDHLENLAELVERIKPAMVSEHLSWNAIGGTHIPDLLPLPLNDEALAKTSDNIKLVQDKLGRQILVENPSSYISYAEEEKTEWDFLNELAEVSGCGLLFDINNIYVSGTNRSFDAEEYVSQIDKDKVKEIHLAGYTVQNIEGTDYYIDTHGNRVFDPVWELYEKAIERLGAVPTLIEWDTDVPEFSVLEEEAAKAQKIMDEKSGRAKAA